MLSSETQAQKAAAQMEWRRKKPKKAKAQRDRYWEKKAREAKEAKENK